MRKTGKRVLIAAAILTVLVAVPGAAWVSLTFRPCFYRSIVQVPREQREAQSKQFMQQSLQLYNDINNEPSWEAVFSDQEVNAWLAKDLITEFADQLPPAVHEPRVIFELDRVTLAFELDRGPVNSVVWVVARPNVPRPNVLELALEKIRAGVLPLPPDKVLDQIIQHARARGLDIDWKRVDDVPVVSVRFASQKERDDVLLDQVLLRNGEIRLTGRSTRSKEMLESPRLPSRKMLQSRGPRRKTQDGGDFATPPAIVQSSTTPKS